MIRTPLSHRLLMLATLAAASGACHQAQAAAHSQVSLSNYQYTLTDLNPADGIDPSVTWNQGVLTLSLGVSISNGVGYGGAPNSIASKTLSKSFDVPLGTAQSVVYQGFAAASDAEGIKVTVDIPVDGAQWSLLAQYDQSFVLGANTAITFTASADMANSVVVPPGSVDRTQGYDDNGYFDWAPIQASTTALITVGDGPFTDRSGSPPCWGDACASMDYLLSGLRSYQTTDEATDKLLSVTLANNSATTLSKTLSAAGYTYGYATAPLSMVPEPSSAAMVGLGVAGLLACMRGRRRTNTAARA